MKRNLTPTKVQRGTSSINNNAETDSRVSGIGQTLPQPIEYIWPTEDEKTMLSVASNNYLEAEIAKVRADERMQIGQELHDNVNQILMTARLYLHMVLPSAGRDKLLYEKSMDYILDAINEIRVISRELVLPVQREKYLMDCIKKLVDDILFTTPIKISLYHSGSIECLSLDVKISLFRIVQEQMKNIVRYSHSNRVKIDLNLIEGAVLLSIKDNGVGYDPRNTCKGVGMISISQRVKSHNGTMVIKSAVGKGCCLIVSLPSAIISKQ